MAQFRGIGDTATQVKMQQDQMKREDARLAENARQADMQQIAQAKAREQQASQFDKSLAEQSRRFDVEAQSAADRAAREETFAQREFGLAERKMNLAEFGAMLNARMNEAQAAGMDVERQQRLAQLNQYVAATAEEEKRRKNREQLAKGAFGSLAVSGMMNGGVMPVAAIELANRELGDKDNQIVGGGVDPQSGVAFFDLQGADGSRKQVKMQPEKQYAVLQEVYGDDVAKMFADNYAKNSAVSAAIQRAQAAAQMDVAKSAAVAEIKQKDPIRIADSYEKAAANRMKQAEASTDPLAREKLLADAVKLSADADLARKGGAPAEAQAPKPVEITPELADQLGIEPGYRTKIDPQTGETTVIWRKGGEIFSKVFPPQG